MVGMHACTICGALGLRLQVLAGIFGKKTASSLVSKASKTKRRSTLAAAKKEAADRAKELAASRTMEISEVKKYAGKDIV